MRCYTVLARLDIRGSYHKCILIVKKTQLIVSLKSSPESYKKKDVYTDLTSPDSHKATDTINKIVNC